jgi:acetoacetyl-CoA reductase/3-oxoacyl-[acyl-carrier protein] reductase
MKLVDMAKTPFDSLWWDYRLDAMSFQFVKSTLEPDEPKISASGGRAIMLEGDLSHTEVPSSLVAQATKALGGVDVLINNAGFLHQQPFDQIPVDEWDLTFDINLRAPFLLAQAAFPVMSQRGGGHIINIASSGGQLGGPLAPHYAASKAGLICLTKSLARLGAEHNIITHAVSPGLVVTKMAEAEMASEAGKEKLKNIPLGRAGTVDEIAECVCLLAQGKLDYATGQTINLNGGLYF